jgi:hypothetical protein
MDGAHQEDSHVAKSVTSGCWTMCVSIAIYFSAFMIFLRNAYKLSCLPNIDCYYLHSSSIKASACIHYMASATLRTVCILQPHFLLFCYYYCFY